MLGDYEAFKDEIYQLTSIDLNSYKERQMKRRIDSLIMKHGISSYKDYVKLLKTNKEYYDEFINHITINVSEFYRNPDQWKILENEVIPYLLNIFGDRLKIWSAACSTGDEPYSLAMLLSKFLPLSKIRIYATDIDKLVLEKARIGIYNKKSLKDLPREFIDRYFIKQDENTYKITDEIKSCVTFKHHDLLKDPYPSDCSMIVCRNVLIYFTDEAKNRVYDGFVKSLSKNGVLFVGSTEQVLHAAKLGFISMRSFFYIKQ